MKKFTPAEPGTLLHLIQLGLMVGAFEEVDINIKKNLIEFLTGKFKTATVKMELDGIDSTPVKNLLREITK